MISVKVKGIAIDRETELPILILQNSSLSDILPLWIGPFEASAIIIELEGVHPPRPLTHDLMANFFLKHGFRLKRLEIFEQIGDYHNARIIYGRKMRNYTMHVRPSDGIALAIRLNAPIYVTASVMEQAKVKTPSFIFQTQDAYSFLNLNTEKPMIAH